MYDILIKNYYWYGYDLFGSGPTSTIIAFLGYLAFIFGYLISKKNGKPKLFQSLHSHRRRVVSICLLLFSFFFVANSLYLILYYGGNLIYFLSLGFFGSAGNSQVQVPIGFISMFSYSLPTTVLIYWEFGRNKWIKAIILTLVVLLQIARGFRFFIVQIAIAVLCFKYLKNRDKFKVIHILKMLVIVLIVISFMTLFRDSIRYGEGVSLDDLIISNFFLAMGEPIFDNFRIYQNYYGIVKAVPQYYSYIFGRQMIIGTLVMLIPRIIWPSKVSTYGGVGLQKIIGINIGVGQAYPNIGEYYYSFGIIGVVLFMFIFGLWMRSTKIRCKDNQKNELSKVTYSVLLSCSLQLLIRGYTPSNFWMVVFCMLPIWIIEILLGKKAI